MSEPTLTIPEVTVDGDPTSSPDPQSTTDAYNDGFSAGAAGRSFDDSAFDDDAKPEYARGWSAGAATLRMGPADETSPVVEVGEGVVELLGPEALGHLLKIGPWATFLALATSPGGDTQLPPAPVYLSICSLTNHRLSGDDLLDSGAWHGTATLTYADAANEGAEHATTWEHADATVHTWTGSGSDMSWNPVGD